MGTRSLTVVKDLQFDPDGKELAVLYRQFDGYPSGHGLDMAEFLVDFRANGASDLFCQLIHHLKQVQGEGRGGDRWGNFYLYPAETRDCGEEYIYTIESAKGGLNIEVYDVWAERVIFEGPEKQFLEFCRNE